MEPCFLLSTHESIFRVQIIMRKESGRSFFDILEHAPELVLDAKDHPRFHPFQVQFSLVGYHAVSEKH